MVGIFSRLSGARIGHRRTQSALDARQPLPENVEVTAPPLASASHGIQVAIEFKPVEHPSEPVDYDQPVKCPLPEPSILNITLTEKAPQRVAVTCRKCTQDGRIWKERMTSAGTRLRSDLPVVKEGSQLESEAVGAKPRPNPRKRSILPSLSAPEHNLINLLEECNAARDQTDGH